MTSEILNRVFGTSLYSVVGISLGLKALRVSHTISVGTKSTYVNCGLPQPSPVFVSNTLKKCRAGAVNFIVFSSAQLDLTNCYRLRALPLLDSLKEALQREPGPALEVRKLEAMDYVNLIAKPSKLNLIQTELLRIQPYILRKEANAAIIKFFRGSMSHRQVQTIMRRSARLEELWVVVQSYEALRVAVARLKTETPEVVSQDTGIPTFELLYILKAKI